MKQYFRAVGFIGMQVSMIVILVALPVYADHSFGNTYVGKKYSIYLYNTSVGSTTISFEENRSLSIDSYDGFGIYLPTGDQFTALYWAPNYHEEDDLLMIFRGKVVADFIEGWGVVLPSYQFTGIFFFFGYEE